MSVILYLSMCLVLIRGFFYSLANWRKRLGIKANLEMLFLVDEAWKNGGMHMVITFGERISYKTFTKEKSREQWAADIKEQVYRLPEM